MPEDAVKQPDGSLVVTSPGGDVVATHSDPLPATAIPVAAMPEVVEVTVVVPQAVADEAAASGHIWSNNIASAGEWTAQKVETGRAVIDLDAEYRLSINDLQAEVILENRLTNVVTRIWGDANIEVAGQSIGQFWGTSSFQLANGTLITASTVISPTNSSAYMLDKLVITRDAHGLIVTGISNEATGDLQIAQAANATVFDHVLVPGTATTPAGAAGTVEPAKLQAATPPDTSIAATAALMTEKPSVVIKIDLAPSATNSTPDAEQVSVVTAPATTSVLQEPDIPHASAAPVQPAAAILVEDVAPVIRAALDKVDGYDMDDDQRDGLVFVEQGESWIDEWDDKQISAAVLEQTRPGQTFGPNSSVMSRTEFGAVISRFLSVMTTQNLISQMASHNSSTAQHQIRDVSRDFDNQEAAKQAAERAARDRQVILAMMNMGDRLIEAVQASRPDFN